MNPSDRNLPTQPRSQERVQKIVVATQKMLALHGYDGTTIKGIAAEAGIKQTSIYRYFPNKRALVSLLANFLLKHKTKNITDSIVSVSEGFEADPQRVQYEVTDGHAPRGLDHTHPTGAAFRPLPYRSSRGDS